MTPPTTDSSWQARLEALERRVAQLETASAGAKSAHTISVLIAIIDYLRRDDLPEDRKTLLSLKEGEVREVRGGEFEELVRPARRACSAYDVLGILLNEVEPKIRDVFYQNWGDSIVACFKAAERSGLLEADRSTNPGRWKSFEQLAQQIEDYFHSQTKASPTPAKGR